MLMFDDQRVYVDANEAVSRLLKLPRASIVGRRIDDLAAPHLRARLSEGWDGFLRLGSAAGTYEYIGGDGRPVPFDFSATANVLPGTHLIILLAPEKRPHAPTAGEDGPTPGGLTPREQEVLRMVAMGKTGHEIAGALVLSPETVSTHVRNIREKLGARSRAHALAIALRRGEIQL
jgi:DNA-binding CsgD family transcriptional regulator